MVQKTGKLKKKSVGFMNKLAELSQYCCYLTIICKLNEYHTMDLNLRNKLSLSDNPYNRW